MSEIVDHATETIHEHGGDSSSRTVAILVSVLAAMLAVTEIGAKSSQNEFLAEHIAVSDDWAFYQARNIRATIRSAEADTLASMPTASDAGVQKRIEESRAYATRQQEAMKELEANAHHREEVRDHAGHRYHLYEYASGMLQLSIVLASVSVVTRIRTMTYAAGTLAIIAGGITAGVWSGAL